MMSITLLTLFLINFLKYDTWMRDSAKLDMLSLRKSFILHPHILHVDDAYKSFHINC